MALSRVHSWSSGEVLTASDLNAEFNNILTNAASLISPLTGTLDMDGREFIMDGDADSSLTMDTDDKLDVKLGGFDCFIFDGTTATVVNGITFTATATGVGPSIAPHGETNVPITLKGKGTGKVALGQATSTEVQLVADQPITDSSGNEFLKFSKTTTAVNEFTVVNAATGTAPKLRASGEANIGMQLQDSNSNELMILNGVASAVNEVSITNAATTAPARIHATGETNVGLQLEPKGTGKLLLTDGTDNTKKVSIDVSGVTTVTTRAWVFPDVADTFVGVAATQTLTGKTLTSPTINGGSFDTVSGAAVATQANMETGTATNLVVAPGRQHFHAGHPKAWGYITTPTTNNLSYPAGATVVANAAGDYTITHGLTFSAAGSSIAFFQMENGTPQQLMATVTARTTTTIRVKFTDVATTVTDPGNFYYVIFGDL